MQEARSFFFVVNSGSGKQTATGTIAILRDVMAATGHRFEIAAAGPGELDECAARMAARATDAAGVLVAIGGDGTLRSVAQLAIERQLPFGVVPTGTFNYFGRSFGIPGEPREAAGALLTARERAVQVGLVNERVFLVNASVGLYPELLEDREAFKRRFGRNRFVALCSGIATLLRDHRPLLLRFQQENGERTVATSTLFVGNSRLQLTEVGLDAAGVVREDRLAAVVVQPLSRVGLAGVALRGALGSLPEAAGVDAFSFTHLTVSSRATRTRLLKVATDGEIAMLAPPLTFTVAPRSLRLLVPGTVA